MDLVFEQAVEEIQHALQRINTTRLDVSYVENRIARSIGSLIYDLPHIKTGWVSKSLTRDGYRLRGEKATNEHFYSRQQSGREIIRVWRAGELSDDNLYQMLLRFCQVHVVRPEENNRLATIQTEYPELGHEQHYAMAGIELIFNPPSAAPWWWDRCVVRGQEYESMYEAAKKIDIDIFDLKYRCKSTAKKWSDFRMIA